MPNVSTTSAAIVMLGDIRDARTACRASAASPRSENGRLAAGRNGSIHRAGPSTAKRRASTSPSRNAVRASCLVGLCCATMGADAHAADVRGEWAFTVHLPNGDVEHPVCVLKQGGEKLTGHLQQADRRVQSDGTGSRK